MSKIVRFILLDILRNRIIIVYTLLLAAFTWSTLSLEDTSSKGILTLLNIVLLVVPLVSILFSTIYLYNSSEFLELIVSQPIQRRVIWLSMFFGLSICFILAFLVGTGLPLLLYSDDLNISLLLIGLGSFISVIFISIAFLSTVLSRDKAKGIGISIAMWLYFAILYDALVLFLLFQFSDYPIEQAMVGITATSPIDLARILMLLQLDVSAMLGFTGAVFNKYFGNTLGVIIAFGILFIWVLVPVNISLQIFKKKDM